MSNGALTTQVARSLQHEFDGQGFDLLHDHGKKGIDPIETLGKLRSWSGQTLTFEINISRSRYRHSIPPGQANLRAH